MPIFLRNLTNSRRMAATTPIMWFLVFFTPLLHTHTVHHSNAYHYMDPYSYFNNNPFPFHQPAPPAPVAQPPCYGNHCYYQQYSSMAAQAPAAAPAPAAAAPAAQPKPHCTGISCHFHFPAPAPAAPAPAAAAPAVAPAPAVTDKIEVKFTDAEVLLLLRDKNLSKMVHEQLRDGKSRSLPQVLYFHTTLTIKNVVRHPVYKTYKSFLDGSSPIPPMNMAMKQVREDLAKHFGMALDLNSPVYRFKQLYWIYDVMMFRAFLQLFKAVLAAATKHTHFLVAGTHMFCGSCDLSASIAQVEVAACPVSGCSYQADLDANKIQADQNIDSCIEWYKVSMYGYTQEQRTKWDAFINTYIPAKFTVTIVDPADVPAAPAPAPAPAPVPAPAPAPPLIHTYGQQFHMSHFSSPRAHAAPAFHPMAGILHGAEHYGGPTASSSFQHSTFSGMHRMPQWVMKKK